MTRLIPLALSLTLVLGVPVAASAQQKKGEKEQTEKKSPYKPFAELTADATAREGFLDTYEKAGHLYVAVPKERLGQAFLMNAEIAQGIGAAGLFGGTMLDIFEGKVVSLERHGDDVYLMQRPHRYVAPEGTPAAEAVGLTFGSSVLESAKIESIRDDSALVIDAHDWFVSDLSNISQRVAFAVSDHPGQPGNANFDKSRSYLESVKAFPENLNIVAKLTFKTNGRTPLREAPDDRYLPIAIHYTLARLPENPMTPRLGDDRMGYFLTVHKDFSRQDTTYFVRYINRWRLEKGEQTADGLWRPKKPIVYYVDRTVPEEYRPYVAAGIEAWNKAFEAAGWKDAIQARPLPDSADAEDIRYATVRWNVSDQPGYGAIGPSVVDPRTGEILDADVLIEGQFILGFRSLWRNLGSPASMLETALHPSESELRNVALGGELSSLGTQLEEHGGLIRTVLASRGELPPGAPLPMEFVGQALKWTTMHEVGHTLGLRHNFKSSHDTPLDKLQDRSWAERNGVVSSVMDYEPPNIAPHGVQNGYYYTPVVGSSDEWVIAYGYTPDPDRAAALARQAAEPGHAYGTDFDRFFGVDPTVNIYDLAGDPVAWGAQRTAIVAGLIPELPNDILSDNAPYSDLSAAFQTLLGQYATALVPAVKYIGGQYIYRTHRGDPADRGPFVPVSKADQQRALDLIIQRAFAESAFDVPSDVLAALGPNQWLHWGTNPTFNGRQDYPFHSYVLQLQSALLNALTDPARLARIRDAETKFGAENALTIPELFGQLTRAIWSETLSAPGRNISATRRDLQRVYLDRMTDILTNPPDAMPADARAVARVQLQDLQGRLTRRLTPPYEFDDYTYAHLQESRARIEKALEAGLEVEIERRGR